MRIIILYPPRREPRPSAARQSSMIPAESKRLGSVAEQVQCQSATVRAAAVLEQIDALPGAEREAAADQGDGELDLGQRGAEVGGHVVGPLVVMGVGVRILGRDAGEIGLEV